MDYCVLIELSRKTIAFSYYKDDGENRFIPYGDEPIKPLAIYCSSNSNDIRVGSYAAEQAYNGIQGAYNDIFEAIKKPTYFSYLGTEYPINKLLLFGIVKCLKEFFDSVLYGMEGQLEQNASKVPICILVESDLTTLERSYVVRLLTDAGYLNTKLFDSNTLILESIKSSISTPNAKMVFASCLDNDVNVVCLDANTGTPIFEFNAPNAAKNPQIDFVARLIWQEISSDANALSLRYDDCISELKRHAHAFLANKDNFCHSSIRLNDYDYEYFISKERLSNSFLPKKDDSILKLTTVLRERVVSPQDYVLVLSENLKDNSYLRENIESLFREVVIIDDVQRGKIQAKLLNYVKAHKYIIHEAIIPPTEVEAREISSIEAVARDNFSKGMFKEAKDLYTSLGQTEDENKCTECMRLRRAIRTFKLTPKANQQESERKQIIDALDQWLEWGVSRDIVEQEKLGIQLKNSAVNSTNSKVNDKDFNRKCREIKAEVKALVNKCAYKDAINKLKKFIEENQTMNLDEFNQMIDEINEKESTSRQIPSEQNNKNESSKKNEKQNSQKGALPKGEIISNALASEGAIQIRMGNLKDAKNWFLNNGDKVAAADCTTLIRANRQMTVYKNELDSVKKNKNVQAAKRRLIDLKEWKLIYDKYGADYPLLTELIEGYKTIK